MRYRPKVKICCISSFLEARMAMEAGASALGLVGHMPSGPGVISDVLIKEIASNIPASTATFLLTSETKASSIIEQLKKVNTSTIQIVDAITEGSHEEIRKALPHVQIVQVLHVVDEKSVDEAVKVASHVDAILLDSGNPNLTVKELGGTGRVHNWELSKTIVNKLDIPVYLAGGIGPHNVKQALEKVRPYGLDLCSSVRTKGNLDAEKLKRFFDKIDEFNLDQKKKAND